MDYKIAKSFIESLIFSAEEPLTKESMTKILSYYGDFNLDLILKELQNDYNNRGIQLIELDKRYFFKTSDSLNGFMRIETKKTRNLSTAAMETLAIISYHQPVTRAEIEKIRGKPVFRGTLGRPVTWVTDFEFLRHFGLKSIKDLPKVDELESVIL